MPSLPDQPASELEQLADGVQTLESIQRIRGVEWRKQLLEQFREQFRHRPPGDDTGPEGKS